MSEFSNRRVIEQCATFSGQEFTVVVWHSPGYPAFVKEIRFGSRRIVECTEHHGRFYTVDEAIEFGIRTASEMIAENR